MNLTLIPKAYKQLRVAGIWPGITLTGFASLKIGNTGEAVLINQGFAQVAACVKQAGHFLQLLDLRGFQSWEHFQQVCKQLLPTFDALIISIMSVDDENSEKALRIVKEVRPELPVIAGGIHFNSTFETTFPHTDCIVVGEGNLAVPELLEKLSQGESLPKVHYGKTVNNLDDLPFVDRNFFNHDIEAASPMWPLMPRPFITINAGIGCPFICSFCNESKKLTIPKKEPYLELRKIYTTYRQRSIDNLIAELDLLKCTRGLGSIMFHDDLWLVKGDYVEEFIEKFGSRFGRVPFWMQVRGDLIVRYKDLIPGLARVGLTWLSLGFESASPRMLKFLKKHETVEDNLEACRILRENYINVFLNYIDGLPTETEEDLRLTLAAIKQIKPQIHSTCRYTNYPGSALYDFCKANDLGLPDPIWPDSPRRKYENRIKGVDYALADRYRQEYPKYTNPLLHYPGNN